MSCINNTTKAKQKQYHHLTENDRAKIQSLVEQKDEKGKRLFNNTYIANYIGVDKSTISRELRNRKSYRLMIRSGKSIPKPYNAVDAQNNYIFKRGLSKGEYKLRQYPKMAQFIKNKIKIDKLILVSGFNNYLAPDENDIHNKINPTYYVDENEIKEIKKYANEIICIYGDDDPYIPQDVFHKFAESIDAKEVIIKNGGHLDADSGYTEFTELLKYV